MDKELVILGVVGLVLFAVLARRGAQTAAATGTSNAGAISSAITGGESLVQSFAPAITHLFGASGGTSTAVVAAGSGTAAVGTTDSTGATVLAAPQAGSTSIPEYDTAGNIIGYTEDT
jgi:hypothetical protein